MNHRLRDRYNDTDPALARAAEILASVPAITSSEARKERVRKAVLVATPRRMWFPVLLRPGVAIPILLVAGAVAGATIGRPAIVRTYRKLAGTAVIPVIEKRVAPKHPVQEQPERAGQSALTEIAPSPLPPPPPVTPAAKPLNNSARVPKVVGHTLGGAPHASELVHPVEAPVEPEQAAPQAASPAKAAPAQETALVLAAVRALRREHDPGRAGTLLDDYIRRFPDGVLAEEALALAIEAASARGDGRAATLARAYLKRYPQGRFERAARAAAE
jgi:hypothetical protein